MFCEKCGKQLPEDAVFCEFCGSKAENPTQEAVSEVKEVHPVSEGSFSDTKLYAKKSTFNFKSLLSKNKLWLIITGCVIVIAIATAIVFISISKRINVTDYFKAEVTGYNDYGKMDYNLDYEAFTQRILGDTYEESELNKNRDLSDLIENYSTSSDAISDVSLIYNAIDIKAEYPKGKDSEHLSNGDVVKFIITFNEKVAKHFDVKVDEATYDYEVSGLEKAETFDVMQYFDVVFSGIDGEGKAKIINNFTDEKTTVNDITFTFDKNYSSIQYSSSSDEYINGEIYASLENYDDYYDKLSVGDTVTLKASVDEEKLSSHGVILTNLTKEVKVEQLGKYITCMDDVKNAKTVLDDYCKENVSNYLYQNWGKAVHDSWSDDYKNQSVSDDLSLYKTIVTSPKDTSDETHGTVWMIYSVTLNDNELKKPTVYYFAVENKNVIIDSNGDLESEYLDTNVRRGYTSYKDLYEELISAYNLNIEESE